MKICHQADWLAWRLAGIGSTDAAVIAGVHPYMTSSELLAIKLSGARDVKDNEDIARGRNLEPYVRQYLSRLHNCDYQPVLACHDYHDWCRASLDGYAYVNGVHYILEIKCPRRPYNGVPIYYYVQMVHQALVAGCCDGQTVVCRFCYYQKDVGIVCYEYSDMRQQSSYLFDIEVKWWEQLQSCKKLLERLKCQNRKRSYKCHV